MKPCINANSLENRDICVRECSLGLGLFAERDFRSGEFVLRFTGPVISHDEVISKGDAEANAIQIGSSIYIDVRPPEVFTNHSCEPNAGIMQNCELYALRPIRKHEEIQFDYSTTMSEQRWTMICRCGTSSCRGVIGDFYTLPDMIQHRYIDLGIVQPFILTELTFEKQNKS